MAIFHPFYSLIFEKIKAAVGFQKLLCSLIIFTHRCAQLVVNEVEGKEKVFCSFFLSWILQIRSLFEGGVAISDFVDHPKHVECLVNYKISC